MTYLSIILPIYNEEARLHRCLDNLTTYLWNYTHYKFEIVCVLNGCQDKSEEIVERFARLYPQITKINLLESGKGRAVRAGMLQARGTFRMMMDVDLAMPPTEIPKFLAAKEIADVVIGKRPEYSDPFRKLTHWGYKLLTSPLTTATDPQSGFKLFQGICAQRVFERVTITGWGFDVEALCLAQELKYSIMEIPVAWEHDAKGSKLNIVRDGMQMARELFTLRKLHAS